MPRKDRTVLIHYNGKWADLNTGNDQYAGATKLMQPVGLPFDYNVEHVKRKAMGLPNFRDGKAFEVYGIMPVLSINCYQRFLITSDETLKIYSAAVRGMTSFFTVSTEAEEQVHSNAESPETPAKNNDERPRGSQITPATPQSTDHSKRDGSGTATKIVPKAKRSLQTEELPPHGKKLRRLHDALSTPEPEVGSSLVLPKWEYKYDDLKKGNIFTTRNQLRLIIEIANVKERFNSLVTTTGPTVLAVKCKDSTCRWSLRARKVGSTSFYIITTNVEPHTCERNDHLIPLRDICNAMAELFKHKFAQFDTVYTPRQLMKDMKETYRVEVTYRQAFSGCTRGIELIRGTPDQSYQHLVDYSYMLGERNEGTITAIETDADDGFMYYFMGLGVCLKGFVNYSRPAFAVDGTHLTGKRKGVLLSAIGYDANEGIYPVAFGVVDSENDNACAWFMEKLSNAFGKTFSRREDVVIATDRSEPLRKAVEKAFPKATHVFCAQHIKENVKRLSHIEGAGLVFMKAAKAYTDSEYNEAMDQLQKMNKRVYDKVRDIGERRWARVKSKGVRYSLMTTNICECWNAKMLDVKDLPICHLVDYIRKTLMVWFSERRKEANDWTKEYSKHADKTIEDRSKVAATLEAFHVIDEKYEVWEKIGGNQNVVDLSKRTCTCGVFTYDHLPCPHAIAACNKDGKHVYNLCGDYYRTSRWRSMYAPAIHPCLSPEGWNTPEEVSSRIVLHPDASRGKGRPAGGRWRPPQEKPAPPRGKRSCSKCGNSGHYATTCKAN